MRRVLFIPANEKLAAKEIDLENSEHGIDWLRSLDDPYRIFQDVMRKVMGGTIWAEKVRVMGLPDFAMMVDEEGLLKRLPVNRRASYTFYPGVIADDVMVFKFGLGTDTDGSPLENVIDYAWTELLLTGENGLLDLWALQGIATPDGS